MKPKPGVEYLVFAPVEVIADDPDRERFLLDLAPSGLYEENRPRDVEPVPERLHRVFERDLLGVTTDLTVHVFRDRLEKPAEKATEVVTEFDGQELRLPEREAARPDRELVTLRWEQAVEV